MLTIKLDMQINVQEGKQIKFYSPQVNTVSIFANFSFLCRYYKSDVNRVILV